MKVRLFYHDNLDTSLIKDVLVKMISKDFEIVEDDDFDLGISIGGDGTFIHMIRESNFNSKSLFLGINNGTLGFLTEVKPDELKKMLNNLIIKNYYVEELSYEEILVKTTKKEYDFKSLNEIVVRDKLLKTAYLDVYINNEKLESFVGDGVMISTPTGSTSYNLSSGGSIIYNGLNVLEVTPLSPINNYIYRTLNNSIIIPDNREIDIKVTNRTKDLNIFVDGDSYLLDDVINVDIKLSKNKINVIRFNGYDYTKIINNKFLK